MPKVTACVWCWAIIKVPDDYDDLIHKGVCSPACAKAEQNFMAMLGDKSYWEYTQSKFGLNQKEKERNVPRNPRHSPPKAPESRG